jgi:hypothetical protein
MKGATIMTRGNITETTSLNDANRCVRVVGNRVVEIETRAVAAKVWLAVGHVSEPLPTGRRLRAPIEITDSGSTEHDAITNLCRRIELLYAGKHW